MGHSGGLLVIQVAQRWKACCNFKFEEIAKAKDFDSREQGGD